MKVSEAKEKVCPFMSYQSSSSSGESFMSNKTEPMQINCMCGDCMAWEWDKKTVHVKESERGYDGRIHAVDKKKKINSSEEGHCKRIGQ